MMKCITGSIHTHAGCVCVCILQLEPLKSCSRTSVQSEQRECLSAAVKKCFSSPAHLPINTHTHTLQESDDKLYMDIELMWDFSSIDIQNKNF